MVKVRVVPHEILKKGRLVPGFKLTTPQGKELELGQSEARKLCRKNGWEMLTS